MLKAMMMSGRREKLVAEVKDAAEKIGTGVLVAIALGLLAVALASLAVVISARAVKAVRS